MKLLLIPALLLIAGCDRSKSFSSVASKKSGVIQKVGERDKDRNLLMALPGPELAVWLKSDYGILIDWPPGEELQTIHWADRESGQIVEFSSFANLLAQLKHCPDGSTVANFTSCGGGWNQGMPEALREELFTTMKQLGLSGPRAPGDETLCVCP